MKKCNALLSAEAADNYGWPRCQALFPHHHCRDCGWPINNTDPWLLCGLCIVDLHFPPHFKRKTERIV